MNLLRAGQGKAARFLLSPAAVSVMKKRLKK